MSKPKRTKEKTDKEPHWPQIIWGDLEDLASVYRFRDFDEDMHKVPKDDSIDHAPSVNCPCQPRLDEEREVQVKANILEGSIWIHRVIQEEAT